MKNRQMIENKRSKPTSFAWRTLSSILILCFVSLIVCGCKSWGQPGETRAEVDRRHDRVIRANRESMLSDIDKVLLLDKPSMLTDKRLP